MKFGKVDTTQLNAIDFTLPEIHRETKEALKPNENQNPEIRFGATGWGTDEWKGVIYPEKCPKNQYLKHYAKSFDSIELNSTHYRIPKVDTIQKWRADVPETFRFCPKVLQYISHSKALGTDTDRIMEFCDAIAHFEDKLGITFMQLPPYWGIDRLPILEKFLQQWPTEMPLAIEGRHPSLFDEEGANPYFDILNKYKINAVITDVAGARYLMHFRLNQPSLFVRFVGNNFHDTDYTRLDDWIEKIQELIKCGMKDIYFFPHQPENIKPPETADYIISNLKNGKVTPYLKEISWTNKDKQLLLF